MQIRPPRDRAEHRSALACLIQRQGETDPLIEKRIDLLENYARKRGLSLDHCLVAAENGGIEAVLLCLDSPGGPPASSCPRASPCPG